jgi:hypothetical protein
MRGTILGVHDSRGVLLTSDDRRLEFPLTEWKSVGAPSAGQVVDFVDDAGQARAVFAVPGQSGAFKPHSQSMVLGLIGVVCLVLGFVIPFIPTIAAFVLGVIGAGQARAEQDESALVLSRIAWIGAAVLLTIGIIAMLAVFTLIGTIGAAAFWHGIGASSF